MSWMAKLCETYDQAVCKEWPEDKMPIPVCHTLQNAHVNIRIDSDGNFISAQVMEKRPIVLPATEEAAGRTSGEAPFPLADKLQYVAGDYQNYGGKKKPYYSSYFKLLKNWCESRYSNHKVNSVFSYISKGQVLKDLINHQICFVDSDNKLLNEWPYEITNDTPLPPLLKVLPKKDGCFEQGDAMICWTVNVVGDPIADTWKDPDVQRAWIQFDSESVHTEELCYVTGVIKPAATNHPAKLRHTGDKAKLFSSNDTSGYTFRGRFLTGEHVANVGYETTQKANSALRWLISNQGIKNDDQVFVAWAVSNKPVPKSLVSTLELHNFDECISNEQSMLTTVTDTSADLGQNYAKALSRYMSGYSDGRFSSLTNQESIAIIGIDSATPGRMSIIYYRDFMALDYIKTIEKWHLHMAWPQNATKEEIVKNGKKVVESYTAVYAPSPWSILNAAYGDVIKSNKELKKSLYMRILPCISEAAPLPFDIVKLAMHRASKRNSLEHWEWEQNIGVACALYRGYHHPDRQPDLNKRRDYLMSLDLEYTSRDYLYGRLLAIAERIEESAMWGTPDRNRPTNAARLMQRFADMPASTWLTIRKAIVPYQQRLRTKNSHIESAYNRLIDEVSCLFEVADFNSGKSLSGEYLLGYHCQRRWLRDHKLDHGQWVPKAAKEEDINFE